MKEYRITLSSIGRISGHSYYKLQVRRWWGWRTLGVGRLYEVQKVREELRELEAQP